MPKTDVEQLVVQMSADLKQFEKAFARASGVSIRELRKVERQSQQSVAKIEGTLGRIGTGLKGFAAGFIGGFGIEALIRSVSQAVESVADLADEAKRAGISAEDLQLLAFAAEQAGGSAEDATDLFQKFNKQIGIAATEGGELADLLKANEIALRDQNGEVRTTLDLFFEVVDLIGRARSQQEQSAIAQAAFTRSAQDSLPFLQQGADEIKRGVEAAREAGGAISNELVAKADEFSDRWKAAWKSFSVTARSFLLEVLKSMDELEGGSLAALERRALAIAKEREEQDKTSGSLARRLELEKKLAESSSLLNTPATAALIAQWRAELEKLNAQLAITGPAFERVGRGAQSLGFARGGIGRNTVSGPPVVFPKTKEEIAAEKEVERERLKAERLAQREAEKISDVIEQLKFEQQQLQSSALTQQINNELRQAGVTAMSAQGQQITALVTKNFELAQSEELALEATDRWQESQEALKESMISLTQLGLDAFDSWIAGGQELSDVIEDVAAQLAKAAIQASLFGQGPLAGLFGTSTAGGLFGKLFHQGGVVGSPGGISRRINPALLLGGVKRYHSGGLAGDETLGVLKKNEIVLPAGVKPGGSGFAKVIVNNFGGEVQQRETRGPGGDRTLEIQFNAMFDKRLSSPSTQKFLGGGFGVRPSLTRR